MELLENDSYNFKVLECFGTSQDDYVHAMTHNGDDLYLCGFIGDGILNSSSENYTSNGGLDLFVAKYNVLTKEKEWITRLGSEDDDVCYDIEYINGKLYVAGSWGKRISNSPSNQQGYGVLMILDSNEGNVEKQELVILENNKIEQIDALIYHENETNEGILILQGKSEDPLGDTEDTQANLHYWLMPYDLNARRLLIE